jgi:succinate dehydrogenase / fumarate reductase iron-sulfur subunit
MNFRLKIWRQRGASTPGELVDYDVADIPASASFLEMLDILNENLMHKGEEPIAHDSDCREGICGTCSLTINGVPHGNDRRGIATCQLHMRTFSDGETIYIEPFRARAFPIIRDLIVDRSALDRVIQAGGYVGVRTGSAPEANGTPVPKFNADLAMDAAACIGCGACVAACPNAISRCSRKASPNVGNGPLTWSVPWTRKGLEIVQTCIIARRCAQSRSAHLSSPA